MVLKDVDGERQLVGSRRARDKSMGDGGTADTADAGATIYSNLRASSAAHRLVLVWCGRR